MQEQLNDCVNDELFENELLLVGQTSFIPKIKHALAIGA
jgi:hypothetical protein